jgi:hypothetical protein
MVNLEAKLLARFPWVVGVLLAVLVANGFFYGLVLARLDSLTQDLNVKWEENENSLGDLESQLAGLSDTVDRIAAGKEVFQVLAGDILLSRRERFVDVQEELINLMNASGVKGDKISYDYETIPPKREAAWGRRYLKTTVSLTVEGSYPQVKDFIRSLHNSDEFFILEGISVSTSSQGATVLRAGMEISTYFIYSEEDGILTSGGRRST